MPSGSKSAAYVTGVAVLALAASVAVLLANASEENGGPYGEATAARIPAPNVAAEPSGLEPLRSSVVAREPDSPRASSPRLEEPPAEPAATTGTVSVRVIDRATILPVPGARVRVTVHDVLEDGVRLGLLEGVSDAGGRFETVLTAGSLRICAFTDDGRYGRATGRLRADDRADLEVELEAMATIRGRVVDKSSRAPVAGARLHNHASSAMGRGEAMSGPDGYFEFPSWTRSSAATLTVEAPGYGPGCICLLVDAEGRWARIGEDQDFELRTSSPFVEVELEPEQWIRGRVVTRGGTGLGGVRVRAVGTAPASFFLLVEDGAETVTEPDGSFELGGLRMDVPHLLLCDAPPEGIALRWVEPHVPTQDLGTIVLSPAAAVEGLAQDARGFPLAGADVRVEIEAPAVIPPAELASLSPGSLSRLVGTGQVDRQGRFLVGGLVPGRATLVLRLGDDEVARRTLDLVEGQRIRVPQIATEEEVVLVESVLVDGGGAPLADRTVVLLEDDSVWGRARTDSYGTFALSLPREWADTELTLALLGLDGEVASRWTSYAGGFPRVLRGER